MKDGVKVKVARYGEGFNSYVKYPDHWLDYGDERHYPKNWQGITASAYTGSESKTEFSATAATKQNIFSGNKEYADNYRKRFLTQEGEALVDRRFNTTNGLSQTYYPEEFQVKQIRPLKGAPNSVGKLRQSIVTGGGAMSWQTLRKECQKCDTWKGQLDLQQLEDALVAFFGGLVPVSGRPTRPEDVMGLVLGEFSWDLVNSWTPKELDG